MDGEKKKAIQRGRRIANQRKKLRMRSADVAALLNVSTLTYWRCEQAMSESALATYGERLSKILMMPVQQIKNGEPDEADIDPVRMHLAFLGSRAQSRRLDMGTTKLCLGAKLKIGQHTLSAWELQLPKRPKVDLEALWERELDVPSGWLRDASLEASPIEGNWNAADGEARHEDLTVLGTASADIEAVANWLSRNARHRRTTNRLRLTAQEARAAEMFVRRYGVYGSEQSTLQAIGDKFGLTRERVRQILQKMLDRAGDLDVQTPIFEGLQAKIEKALPASVESIEDECRGMLGQLLCLEDADRFAREVLGRQIAHIKKFSGPTFGTALKDMVGSPEALALVKAARECALKAIRYSGAAHALFVTGMVSERIGAPVQHREVVTALHVVEGFEWLTDDKDWFWFGEGVGYNSPLDSVRKMLAVAGRRLDVEDLHQGICRGRRLTYDEDRAIPLAVELPLWVLKALLRKVSWLKTVQHDDFVLLEERNLENIVSQSERFVIEAISSHGGVSSRQMLKRELIECGAFSSPALDIALTSSPVVQPLGDGMFSVRGRIYTVAALENARKQFGGKPKENLKLDSDGRIEFTLQVSEKGLQNSVLDLPGNVGCVMPKGEYRVTGKVEGTVLYGMVPTAPNRITRLATMLKNAGVTAEDELLMKVDRAKRQIEIVVIAG